jgi:hypothetical protein
MKQSTKQTTEQKLYTLLCEDFKLKPEWLGKTFRDSKGRAFTITGLNPRSKTYPVLTNTGTQFNADYVRGLITGDMASIDKERQQKHELEYKQARKDYPIYCDGYGLKPSWLDKTFVEHGQTWRIDGLKLSSRKYPVLVRSTQNSKTTYFFSSDYVITLMKEQSKRKAA